MNQAFLKQLDEENMILEQELQQLLQKQDSLRFSFSNTPNSGNKLSVNDNDDYNNCNHIKSTTIDNTQLSQIDEEQEEEQQLQPLRMQESPSKYGIVYLIIDSMLDNLMDSINNYMVKRRDSSSEPKSQRQSETKRSESASKQIRSLEMRLSGTREALKALEKEVKDKNQIIQNLQIDLNKKQKHIDQLQQSQPKTIQVAQPTNTEGFQELKKTCKDLEKRYLDSEVQLKENKKYMQRLQELNQQLLVKLKQYEQDKDNQSGELDDIASHLTKYEQTVQGFEKQLNLEKDRYRGLQIKYDELKQSSDDFLLNTRELRTQYEHMLNTLQQIANNY